MSRILSKDQAISHKPLCALTYLAVSCRLFYLVVIDLPEVHNAAWLAVALGAVFASPVIAAACALLKRYDMQLMRGTAKATGGIALRAYCAFAALAFTYEAAALLLALTNSANYASLYNTPAWLLLAPTALACTVTASRGGNASGGVAIIWLRVVPFLYFLVLVWQYRSTNTAWLTPLFGPGLQTLAKAGLLCATYFCFIPVAFLIGDGMIVYGRGASRKAKPRSIAVLFAACALTVVILCAIHASMYPNIPDMSDSRSLQLDLLMSNGKSNRAIQLPMLLVWYGSLAVTTVFMLYCAGRLAAIAIRRRDSLTTLLGGGAGGGGAPGLAKQNWVLLFSQYALYPMGGFFLWILALSLIRKKGGCGA